MMKKKKLQEKGVYLLLIFLAILPRLLYLPIPFIVNVADAAGYVQLSQIFLNGLRNLNLSQFADTYLYRTPTYPIFLAMVKFLFGQNFLTGLSLIQHLLGICLVLIVYKITKRIARKTIAFAASLLVAFNPHLLYWEHNAMTEFFSTFLIVFSIFFLIKAVVKEKIFLIIFTGFLFGITILCRPGFFLIWVFIPFFFFMETGDIRKSLIFSGYFLLSLFLTLTPWLAKNYFRHHFLGLSTLVGPSAMNRVEKYVDFSSGVHLPEKKIYKKVIDYYQPDEDNYVVFPAWGQIQKEMGYGEVEIDCVFRDIFLETVKNNPRRYLEESLGEAKKMLRAKFMFKLLSDVDVPADFRDEYSKKLESNDSFTKIHYNLVSQLNHFFLPYTLLFIFSLQGAIIAWWQKKWEGVLYFWLIIYVVFFTTLVANGLFRYRLPAEPFLIMLGFYFLGSLYKFFKYLINLKKKDS